jgi:F-type H+-transporting ATPase subunit b
MLAGSIAAMAQAAEDMEHALEEAPNPANFQVAPFITAIVLFITVVLILNKVAWPPILKALQDREDKIRTDIEHAQGARSQAERALQEYQKALAEARNEAAKMLDEAKVEQQRLAAQLRAKTDAEISAMRDSATRDIEAAKRSAIADIYSNMADTATSIASKILERELNPADQAQLVEASLGQLDTVRSN